MWRVGEGLDVWMSGTWSERAGLLSVGNKYCRHQWEMIHLFNVPFSKWNPCNPTDMATSPCISPLWNLIRAKTVYQCLEPDIYWKWPLVKVIAKAWRGFVMRPWSFSIFWANKTENRCVNRAIYQSHRLRNRPPQRTQLSKYLLRHGKISSAANFDEGWAKRQDQRFLWRIKKQWKCLYAPICLFSAMLAAQVQGWQCLSTNRDI